MRIVVAIFIFLMLISSAMADGMTIKSVSYVPFSSNDRNMSGDKVILDIVAMGSASSISGTWNGSGLPDRMKVSQPLNIRIENQKQKALYENLNQGALYRYLISYRDAEEFYTGAKCDSVPSFCFHIDTDRVGMGFDRVLVVNRVYAASYARISNPIISTTVDIMIKINNTEHKQSIGSGQEARGSVLFPGLGNAIWAGMSMNGDALPNQNNYVATHTDSWKVANFVSYESYIKSFTNTDSQLTLMQEKEGSDGFGYSWKTGYENTKLCSDELCTNIVNLINIHNSIVDTLLEENVEIGYGSPTSNQKTIERQIGYSNLVLTLNAKDIGVYTSVGKPQIENISISPQADGDGLEILRVDIRNIGDAEGNFGIRMNGSIEQHISLNPGHVGSVNLTFSGIEGYNSGIVEAYDLNSAETDTRQYQVNITTPKRYIPDSEEVYNNMLLETDSSGMIQTEIQGCEGLWQFRNGEYGCFELDEAKEQLQTMKNSIVLPVPTQSPPPQEKTTSDWYLALLGMLFGMVIILIFVPWQGKRKNQISVGTLIVTGAIMVISVLIIIEWDRIVQWKGIIKYILENII